MLKPEEVVNAADDAAVNLSIYSDEDLVRLTRRLNAVIEKRMTEQRLRIALQNEHQARRVTASLAAPVRVILRQLIRQADPSEVNDLWWQYEQLVRDDYRPGATGRGEVLDYLMGTIGAASADPQDEAASADPQDEAASADPQDNRHPLGLKLDPAEIEAEDAPF